MNTLPQDITKLIFNELSPTEYQSLLKSNKSMYRIGSDPRIALKETIFSFDFERGKCFYKVSKIGTYITAFVGSAEFQTTPEDLRDGYFKYFGEEYVCESKLDKGYLSERIIMWSRDDGRAYVIPLKDGKFHGTFKSEIVDNVSEGWDIDISNTSATSKTYVDGVPKLLYENQESINESSNGKFGTVYHSRDFVWTLLFVWSESSDGENFWQIRKEDTEYVATMNPESKESQELGRFPLDAVLTYLPKFLTSEKVPISSENIAQTILPLRIEGFSVSDVRRSFEQFLERIFYFYGFYLG